MKKNVGALDRVIRLLLAVVIGMLWYNGTITGILGIVLAVVAAALLVTGLVGSCPLYTVLNLSTKRTASQAV